MIYFDLAVLHPAYLVSVSCHVTSFFFRINKVKKGCYIALKNISLVICSRGTMERPPDFHLLSRVNNITPLVVCAAKSLLVILLKEKNNRRLVPKTSLISRFSLNCHQWLCSFSRGKNERHFTLEEPEAMRCSLIFFLLLIIVFFFVLFFSFQCHEFRIMESLKNVT